VIRTRIATAALGLAGLALLAGAVRALLDGAPFSALAPLALALLYGALAWGVRRERPWARWLGMGVGLFGVLAAVLLAPPLGWAPPVVERGLALALHAALPLCLARPDAVHPRTSLSLLLAGAALVPALAVGVDAVGGLACAHTGWAPLAAAALATVGTVGLARERTWGLLVVGLGGAALLLDDRSSLVGLLLVVAALPFLGPVVRFLRGDRA
jgi:hypothetical protein